MRNLLFGAGIAERHEINTRDSESWPNKKAQDHLLGFSNLKQS